MNDPIYFTELIKPICLPRRDRSVVYKNSETGIVTGWGMLGNSNWATQLHKTEVIIIDTEICKSIMQTQGQHAWDLSKGFNPVTG